MVYVSDAVPLFHRPWGVKLTQREDHLGGVGGEAALADGCLDPLKASLNVSPLKAADPIPYFP